MLCKTALSFSILLAKATSPIPVYLSMVRAMFVRRFANCVNIGA